MNHLLSRGFRRNQSRLPRRQYNKLQLDSILWVRHGTYSVSDVVYRDADWLVPDRRYADEPAFPRARHDRHGRNRVERGGTIVHERRNCVCSIRGPATMLRYKRTTTRLAPTSAPEA